MGDCILSTAHRMFEHACAFVDCAEYCQVEPNHIRFRTTSHSVSAVVNTAFACEVFIKTLLVFHGVPLKDLRKGKYGHNLENLWEKFKKTDDKMALSVEQEMQARFNSQDGDLFSNLLKEASTAFVYWRYIYEETSGCLNLNFLCSFRYVLRNTCCKCLHGKTWGEYIGDCQ